MPVKVKVLALLWIKKLHLTLKKNMLVKVLTPVKAIAQTAKMLVKVRVLAQLTEAKNRFSLISREAEGIFPRPFGFKI
jgi:hypothetical protein